MPSFFARNIDWRGRLARTVFGIVLIIGGLLLARFSWWACGGLVLAGAFSLYEAARGWCVMRACGIKTKW